MKCLKSALHNYDQSHTQDWNDGRSCCSENTAHTGGGGVVKQHNLNPVHLPSFSCPAFARAVERWFPYNLLYF